MLFFTAAHDGWIPIEITQLPTGWTAYAKLDANGQSLFRINLRGYRLHERSGHEDTAYPHCASLPVGANRGHTGTLDALIEAGHTRFEFLDRHVCGDWGELPPEDEAANEQGLFVGTRLFSAYTLPDGAHRGLSPSTIARRPHYSCL